MPRQETETIRGRLVYSKRRGQNGTVQLNTDTSQPNFTTTNPFSCIEFNSDSRKEWNPGNIQGE